MIATIDNPDKDAAGRIATTWKDPKRLWRLRSPARDDAARLAGNRSQDALRSNKSVTHRVPDARPRRRAHHALSSAYGRYAVVGNSRRNKKDNRTNKPNTTRTNTTHSRVTKQTEARSPGRDTSTLLRDQPSRPWRPLGAN